MQKRRSRADRWWEARCRQGVNRPGGASERSTAGEAVQLLKAGGTQNLRSRCDRHGWKRLRTGVPCARRMLPLESRMREIRTSGSVSRGWKRTYDDGLTHRRESGRKTLRTLRAPRHLLTLQKRARFRPDRALGGPQTPDFMDPSAQKVKCSDIGLGVGLTRTGPSAIILPCSFDEPGHVPTSRARRTTPTVWCAPSARVSGFASARCSTWAASFRSHASTGAGYARGSRSCSKARPHCFPVRKRSSGKRNALPLSWFSAHQRYRPRRSNPPIRRPWM